MFSACRLFAVCLSLALTGCSSLSTPDRWSDALAAMPASRGDLSQLVYQDLPDDGVLVIHFDTKAPAHEFASGKSVYSAWRLAGAPQPFFLKVEGDPPDRKILKLFLPFADDLIPVPPMQLEALLLDGQFREITRIEGKGKLTVQFPSGDGGTSTVIRNHQVFEVAVTTQPAEYLVLLTSDAARRTTASVRKDFVLFSRTHRFKDFSPFGEIRAYMYTPGIPGEHISLRLSASHMAGKPKRSRLPRKGKIEFPLELLFGERAAYVAHPVSAYSGSKGQRVLLEFSYDRVRELRAGADRGLHWITLGVTDKTAEAIEEQTLLFFDAATAMEATTAFADRTGIAPSAPSPEHQRLAVAANQGETSVGFADPPGGSAWSRVGDMAMAGGVVLAAPCALCNAGGCTPDLLAPCALLFSAGAAVGAITGAGKELISGGFFRADGKPVASASEHVPRIDTASRILLDQTRLRDCLLDAAHVSSPATGLPAFEAPGQTRFAQLEPVTLAPNNQARTYVDLTGQGYDALLESRLQKLVLQPELLQGHIELDSPVSLRLEAKLSWLDLPSGDIANREVFGFISEVHPLKEWTSDDNHLLKETLQRACVDLGGQMLLRAEQMWLDQ